MKAKYQLLEIDVDYEEIPTIEKIYESDNKDDAYKKMMDVLASLISCTKCEKEYTIKTNYNSIAVYDDLSDLYTVIMVVESGSVLIIDASVFDSANNIKITKGNLENLIKEYGKVYDDFERINKNEILFYDDYNAWLEYLYKC